MQKKKTNKKNNQITAQFASSTLARDLRFILWRRWPWKHQEEEGLNQEGEWEKVCLLLQLPFGTWLVLPLKILVWGIWIARK